MLSQAQVVSVRNAFNTLYKDVCNIYEKQKVKREDHSTIEQEVKVIGNEPCRIDFDTEPNADTTTGVAIAPQTITLFIRPDINIKAGSKIEVTFTDIVSGEQETKYYAKGGESAKYMTHQEIALTLFDKYA